MGFFANPVISLDSLTVARRYVVTGRSQAYVDTRDRTPRAFGAAENQIGLQNGAPVELSTRP